MAAWAALILLLFVGAGCSGLCLERPLKVREDDWPTFGKTANHINATKQTINPPLTLEWENDITGGIGNGSPLIIDSLLLIGNLRGELYAIHVRTGKRVGYVNLGDAIQGSPVIDGSLAIVATSNSKESLVAFDLLDGKVRWKRSYGDIEVTPLLLNQKIFVATTTGVLYCVDRATGDLAWKFEIPENIRLKGIRSSPAGEGTTVVFGADDGAVYAFDAETGRQRWKFQTDAGVVAPPSVMDGTVYVGNLKGTLYALDLTSGRLGWKFESGSSIYANPTLVHGLVVFGTVGGTVFSLHARDVSTFWKNDLGSPINSGAVAAGSMIYVGTLKKLLFAVRLVDGSVAWKGEVTGRIKTTPAVADGRLFVATDERLVLSFRGTTQ